MINGRTTSGDGPIKTFPLRGIKESPPYMHDGKCMTLEDTVELFNLLQGLKLTAEEKASLVAFMHPVTAEPRRAAGLREDAEDGRLQ